MPYLLGRFGNIVNIAFKYKVSGNINLYLKTAFYNYKEDYLKIIINYLSYISITNMNKSSICDLVSSSLPDQLLYDLMVKTL
jgi:hypothetical protein